MASQKSSFSTFPVLKRLKDEFNLKAIDKKGNLVLKFENLNDEITTIQENIESSRFDQNFVETINQH